MKYTLKDFEGVYFDEINDLETLDWIRDNLFVNSYVYYGQKFKILKKRPPKFNKISRLFSDTLADLRHGYELAITEEDFYNGSLLFGKSIYNLILGVIDLCRVRTEYPFRDELLEELSNLYFYVYKLDNLEEKRLKRNTKDFHFSDSIGYMSCKLWKNPIVWPSDRFDSDLTSYYNFEYHYDMDVAMNAAIRGYYKDAIKMLVKIRDKKEAKNTDAILPVNFYIAVICHIILKQGKGNDNYKKLYNISKMHIYDAFLQRHNFPLVNLKLSELLLLENGSRTEKALYPYYLASEKIRSDIELGGGRMSYDPFDYSSKENGVIYHRELVREMILFPMTFLNGVTY